MRETKSVERIENKMKSDVGKTLCDIIQLCKEVEEENKKLKREIKSARADEREKIEKIMIGLAYQKKENKVVRVDINHLDVMKRLK